MKKRIFQKWFVSAVLIACIICATMFLLAPNFMPHTSVGPEIYYYYNDSAGNTVEAADSSEFVESIQPSEIVDSVYVLDYAPYDTSLAQFADFNASKSEVDSIREKLKAQSKAYYSSKNQEFISSLGIDENSLDYQVVVSNYSPYVQISYEDKTVFQKYKDDFIDGAKSNSDIREIHVSVPIETKEQAAHIIDKDNAPNYNMEDVLSDIGADDQTYDGSGLNVGIMEARGVAFSTSHPELAGLNIYTAGDSQVSHWHAENVTRLLCGSEGVVRDINSVYIYHKPYWSDYIPAMNWFIDNNCHLINASLGSDSYGGKYIWTSAFMDFQVRYNRIIFVAAAGNEGANDVHYVTPPGTGYNAITVANSTKNAYIFNSSSYGFENDLKMNKPTLAAPGTGLHLNGKALTNDNGQKSAGTSYSAPIVTGIIVKLIDEYPALQLFPEAVSALLIVSATNANGQNDSWDARAGAGIVNYQRARQVMSNSTCKFFYNNKDLSQSGQTLISEDFAIQKGEKVRAVAIWSANSQTKAWGDTVQTNIHANYNLYLKLALDENIRIQSASGYTNMQFFVKEIKYNYNNLRLCVMQKGDRKNNDEDYGAMAWYIE